MSLDNMELTAFLMQGLYKNSLVETVIVKKQDEILPASSFNTLGNNKDGIIIVIEDEDNLYLPDGQLNFLLGILSACKLTMDDVAVINLKKCKKISYKEIELELKAKKIFLFGVPTANIGLPLEFPPYQIQHYNQQTYVVAGSLLEIEKNKADKTKLWNCLKQIFTA